LFLPGCSQGKGHSATAKQTQSQRQTKAKTPKQVFAEMRKAIEKQKQAAQKTKN